MGFSGKENYLRRLATLPDDMERELGKAVYVGADMIRAEAFQSISRGSVSGKNHVPSAPGEPPNRDTGILQANIEATQTGPLTAEVTSSARYAAPLEFGTSKMAARPYMRPARDKLMPKIQRMFDQTLNRVISRIVK